MMILSPLNRFVGTERIEVKRVEKVKALKDVLNMFFQLPSAKHEAASPQGGGSSLECFLEIIK